MSAAKLFIFALALASTQAFSLRVKGGLISEKKILLAPISQKMCQTLFCASSL